VLTSHSCSEEGLEDAANVLLQLSRGDAVTRDTVLRLLLSGARTLGATLCRQIGTLLAELREYNLEQQRRAQSEAPSPEGLPEEQPPSAKLKGKMQSRSAPRRPTAPHTLPHGTPHPHPCVSVCPQQSEAGQADAAPRRDESPMDVDQPSPAPQDAPSVGSEGSQGGEREERPPELPLLSEQLCLDELWDMLGECLKELEESHDQHAVLGGYPNISGGAPRYFRQELERLDEGLRKEDMAVHVRRDHVFEDSYRELHRKSPEEMKNRLYIVFEGEEGQDAGGLLREWYMIISREMFNPMYALFRTSPGDRVTYTINPSSHCNPNHLSYFKFVGRIVAKAVYDNRLLECYFTRSFYKHILGKSVRYTDMESEDYHFYQGLVYLLENDVSTLGYDLTFSTEVTVTPPGIVTSPHVVTSPLWGDRGHPEDKGHPPRHTPPPQHLPGVPPTLLLGVSPLSLGYIVFEGEEGQDAGGLLREWYMIISREMFNPMYALFRTSPGDRVTYTINPSSHCNPNHLSYFKFVGRIVAKAVYDNRLLECYFTRSFYKHILGKSVRYTDMESEDYHFYQGLVYLLENDVSTLGYDLTFSTEVTVTPPGIVTSPHVVTSPLWGAIRKQLAAFLEGFYEIIPKRLISIFTEQELELLISGLPTIDIDDLKANTEYHKYQGNSIQIQWFWRALRSFDQADRAKFLQFVTGTSKVPLQGFAALEGMNGIQKFQIHRDDRSTDRLPS
ncbi:PREDICTED: E3 ubiquitin-protein ligase HUWE1-like, partial [Calidris pugnax]|uniref:E3 ubiquitin-protein ligase HUWE1-like n=1 Tax=Calidris pugnax TaxID=198806 RepID=UPI00071C6CC4